MQEPSDKAIANSGGTARGIANLRPFEPGRSGNPLGRPKVGEEVRRLAREHGPDAFRRLVELLNSDDERIALMAVKEVLDRAYGKARSADEDDGGGEAVTVVVQRLARGEGPGEVSCN